MSKLIKLFSLLMLCFSQFAYADPTALAVWVNEAIVATYTYDYTNFIARQREIARYFTAPGWTSYSTALNASKLPETIQQNKYYVSAVATMPPEVKSLGQGRWQAIMPLLVIYKNPQYQQKQSLQVTIDFGQTSRGQGIRGLAINSLQAKVSEPPCVCASPKKDETQQQSNAQQ